MEHLDHKITQSINSLNTHVAIFDISVIWLAKAIVPVMVALMVWNWWSKGGRDRARYVSIAAGLNMGLAVAWNQIISHIIMRPRPYDAGITNLIIEKSSDPSFPSDHATAAFAIAFSLLLLRHSWGNFFFILASFLAFARVFVGIHYFSDVMGGMLSGFVAAFVVAIFIKESNPIVQRLIKLF